MNWHEIEKTEEMKIRSDGHINHILWNQDARTAQSVASYVAIHRYAFEAFEFLQMHFQKYPNYNRPRDTWLTFKNNFKQRVLDL